MTWEYLRKELQNKFGKDGFRFYNDKRKSTRRIKICGENKYRVLKYLNRHYPKLVIDETYGSTREYYNGICFNLEH